MSIGIPFQRNGVVSPRNGNVNKKKASALNAETIDGLAEIEGGAEKDEADDGSQD